MDELEGISPANDSTLFKRILALKGAQDIASLWVDLEDFTHFMKYMPPDPSTAPLVQPQCSNVFDSFHASLMLQITSKLKKGKSPGPDFLNAEMFTLYPELFSDATLELWRAVGRIAHAP